jgi:uncharacterized protein YlxP (DUF503 family)
MSRPLALAFVGRRTAVLITLGILCVSDDPRHANAMLSKVIDFIESERLDAEVGGVEMELIAV